MGHKSQRKGRRAELELSAILNAHGYDTRPGKAVSYGTEPDIVGLPGIHLELKRRESPDIPSALRQATDDAMRFGDGLPAVFIRGNRQKWRVVMRLDDWLKLYKWRPEKAPAEVITPNGDEQCCLVDFDASTAPPKKPRPKIEILRNIATLRVRNQCHTEFNIVRFDDNAPTYDIRRWHRYPNGYSCASSRGITMSITELLALRDALIEEFPLN